MELQKRIKVHKKRDRYKERSKNIKGFLNLHQERTSGWWKRAFSRPCDGIGKRLRTIFGAEIEVMGVHN